MSQSLKRLSNCEQASCTLAELNGGGGGGGGVVRGGEGKEIKLQRKDRQ